MHDLAQRLIRLAREAGEWLAHEAKKMTSEQFDALAALMGQPDSKKRRSGPPGAGGRSFQREAARRVGITTQGANQPCNGAGGRIELAKVVGGEAMAATVGSPTPGIPCMQPEAGPCARRRC